MARGWESKSVESQMESAEERRALKKIALTPEQMERERKRDSLQLQRVRVLRDLENCHGERYRQTLTEGLAYLDAQLAALN